MNSRRLALLLAVLFILSILRWGTGGIALAQFVPVPPPSSVVEQQSKDLHAAANDKSPPKIEILTKLLSEGKSVFKVSIKDESGIASAFIKYVNDGKIKTEALLPRGGDLYEALIDIHPPSRIVELQAVDAAGNTLNTYATFDVLSPNDLFSRIRQILTQWWESVVIGR